jgi:hypothetical protein
MTEFQKIAIGLLGLTHPEIFAIRNKANRPVPPAQPNPRARRVSAAVRAVKFAFAALVTGSRAVPLGDNSQLTKELGAYAARLRR